MKRGNRAWPKGIIEIASTRPDPRAADPQATQKISLADLEAALRRTKSGTRAAQRSEPRLDDEVFAGPRDDSPEITIVGIDTAEEFEAVDPSTLISTPAAPSDTRVATPTAASPLASSIDTKLALANRRSAKPAVTRRLHVTPQLALLVGLALLAFVTLAAIIGFFAGRIAH